MKSPREMSISELREAQLFQEKQISLLNNKQTAVKILLNALFGATANKYYRYFNLHVAEGITLTGQLTVQWAELHINEMLNKHLKTPGKDRVIAMDTDSVYLALGDLIKEFKPKDPCVCIDEYCKRMLSPEIDRAYRELALMLNAYEHRLAMKREAIASRAIWTKKKRYILNVLNSEGVQYSQPKIKIKGLEAVKTSTPMCCRAAMKKLFAVIMNEDEAAMQKSVAEFREKFNSLKPEEIAFPRGISDLQKYSREATIYSREGRPATPIHCRGALLFNHHIKKNNLEKRYQLIQSGDKIKYVYLKTPNPIKENIIGFIDVLPPELGLHRYVDYDLQFQKSFIEPFEIVLDAIKWHAVKIDSIDDFFS